MTIDEAIAEIQTLLPEELQHTHSAETFEYAIRKVFPRMLDTRGDCTAAAFPRYIAAATLDGAQRMNLAGLRHRLHTYWEAHAQASVPEWRKVEIPKGLVGHHVEIIWLVDDRCSAGHSLGLRLEGRDIRVRPIWTPSGSKLVYEERTSGENRRTRS